MSGPESYGPKFIEESMYDSVCALCANEIPIGAPLWWFNKKCYCMEHSKAEVRTEAAVSEPSQSSPSHHPTPTGLPSTLPDLAEMFRTAKEQDARRLQFWGEQMRELCRVLERTVNAIDLQTEILKGMRKDNNERR